MSKNDKLKNNNIKSSRTIRKEKLVEDTFEDSMGDQESDYTFGRTFDDMEDMDACGGCVIYGKLLSKIKAILGNKEDTDKMKIIRVQDLVYMGRLL